MGSADTDTLPFLLERREGPVLWLTLNRPAQRNPLSAGMIAALDGAITAAGSDPQLRVVVLAGSGPVFSAGHDLREMARGEGESREAHRQRVRQTLEACAAMMLGILHSPRPIIACVQGTATAAGCQLVSACDLALACDTARFCTPGVNIGTFCTTPLVGIGRNLHRKHALEMALSGDLFGAEDAIRFGLINRAVPARRLEQEVRELAAKIASKSAQSIALGKPAFYRQIDMPVEEAFRFATEQMLAGLTSEDAAEGTRAFLEKRPPRWSDN